MFKLLSDVPLCNYYLIPTIEVWSKLLYTTHNALEPGHQYPQSWVHTPAFSVVNDIEQSYNSVPVHKSWGYEKIKSHDSSRNSWYNHRHMVKKELLIIFCSTYIYLHGFLHPLAPWQCWRNCCNIHNFHTICLLLKQLKWYSNCTFQLWCMKGRQIQ